ncbi:MAG: RagB/SusD family nutrient uptake outer membrane protein [Gemmatimonadales bacterium]
MRRLTFAVPAILALLVAGGCDDIDVGDLNNPGLESLQDSPTRTGVLTLATGMQIGSRYTMGNQNGYGTLLGILGREVYNFDAADPRFITELLLGPLDPGSPAFGGNLYQNFYANIRTGNILLRAIGNLASTDPLAGLTAPEREGLTGYVKTMQAYDYLRLVNTRDDNGIPLDVDIDPTGPPAAIATKAEAFTHIATLLGDAVTNLNAAGATFAFAFSPGFAGFDTPPTFLQFNQALRARVAAYVGDWNGVLTALSGSFVNSAQPLTLGVYHSFSTTAGDSLNNLFDPTARAIVAHPALETDAQLQVGGAKDQRFLTKTLLLLDEQGDTVFKSSQGLGSFRAMNVYTGPSAAVPIIRNEELILLRAEANINLNLLPAAVTDLNEVRQEAGNLPAYAAAVDQASLVNELLYNRRYSLLFEGHRWIDLRRYNLLTGLSQDPTDLGASRRFSRFPFPTNECLARDTPPAAGCTPEVGF